ncbi:MAG TPA: DedA family protein [Pyrinomonadaceae bacterium]|jgi:membrane protein DedA with SNARE-associated domain|nr:DedA family protein [Pyrinomonadaceae bacterium]
MSLTDQVLAALLTYGLPVLFGLILISAIGMPFPISLVLVAAGSFVEQGEMKLWQVIAVASTGAVLGDQIGYGLSRWGGRRLINRLSHRAGAEARIRQAEALTKRWSGAGIFFSRWLVTALGPWVNVTSGIASYPWRRFLFWDVLGEVLWVVLYVVLGYLFSNRVQAIADILGNLAWVIVGLIVTVILGWKLVQYVRPKEQRAG